MNHPNTAPSSFRLAAALCLVSAGVALSACGGGGGAATASSSTTATTGASTSTASTFVAVAGIVPSASMTWTTQQEQVLEVSVRTPEGGPASGAAVRLFTLTRDDPHGGPALEEPVPLSLLETAVADANGQVRLVRAWPAHLSDVLVVATDGDASSRAAVRLGGSPTTLLLVR